MLSRLVTSGYLEYKNPFEPQLAAYGSKLTDKTKNMKTKILRLITILLLLLPVCMVLLGAGCEKEKNPPCGIENPQENLGWLKQILDSDLPVTKVYSFSSEGNEYIVIESSLGNALMQFYNCNGELKCEVGGAVGSGGNCEMPTEYWSDFENNKKIIVNYE